MLTASLLERPPSGAEWDDLMRRTGASILYTDVALTALASHPLQRPCQVHRLLVRDEEGRLVAGLPVFILPSTDPLGIFAGGAETAVDGPLVLSHTWHWYDTCLPATGRVPEVVSAVAAVMQSTARQIGAHCTGLINMSESDPALSVLRNEGYIVRHMDNRFVIDLAGTTSVASWLARLPRRTRQDVLRQVRRMTEAGLRARVIPATAGDVLTVARLCARTGDRHGNPGWYSPDCLTELILRLGEWTRLIVVQDGAGEIVAGSLSFAHEGTFHNWAAGHQVDSSSLAFSPYQAMLYASVEEAISSGCTILEGGRRNDAWKLRHGMRRVALWGAFARTPR
jgi:Acetyltransferase (GNAT) domain